MPRIRYLKPDFFLDEDIAELPHIHRIAFQGLWCYADRRGRLEDKPKKLKAVIFPYEEVDMNKILNDLQQKPFIIRYSVANKRYIQVVNFQKHQRPHHTEKESDIPEPQQDTTIPVKSTLEHGEKKEGMGMGMGMEKGMGMESNCPYWDAFSEKTKEFLKTLSKEGLNIYQLLNKLRKDQSLIPIPEEVVMRVCKSYIKNKSYIKKVWPWFTKALLEEGNLVRINANIEKNNSMKREGMAKSLKDIISGIGK